MLLTVSPLRVKLERKMEKLRKILSIKIGIVKTNDNAVEDRVERLLSREEGNVWEFLHVRRAYTCRPMCSTCIIILYYTVYIIRRYTSSINRLSLYSYVILYNSFSYSSCIITPLLHTYASYTSSYTSLYIVISLHYTFNTHSHISYRTSYTTLHILQILIHIHILTHILHIYFIYFIFCILLHIL